MPTYSLHHPEELKALIDEYLEQHGLTYSGQTNFLWLKFLSKESAEAKELLKKYKAKQQRRNRQNDN